MVSAKELLDCKKALMSEIKQMQKVSDLGYDDDRASINLPIDKEIKNLVNKLVLEKLKLNPKYIVVVGIGGSNLGTIAIQESVFGKLHNQLKANVKILYVDTVDSDLVNSVMNILEPVLKSGGNIILNGVSKSGGTTETIANFEILVNLLKKYKKNYEQYVVITTGKNSKFWNLADEKGFSVLQIPKKVGGRYSVFSPVGLFPLGMIGININKLLKGAEEARRIGLNSFMKNQSAISAAIIYSQFIKGKSIVDTFLFGTDFESLGKWYRQLMGESIGKEKDRKGKKVNLGITPTVSIGSTDLHSVAQLYLGGPKDKFTVFVSTRKDKNKINIPTMKEYSKLVDHIQGKSLKNIMDAIIGGTKRAYAKARLPFVDVILPDKCEQSIGQFLQFKMMEMMYLGVLLGVNPFDQPNVELYKIETKKLLAVKK